MARHSLFKKHDNAERNTKEHLTKLVSKVSINSQPLPIGKFFSLSTGILDTTKTEFIDKKSVQFNSYFKCGHNEGLHGPRLNSVSSNQNKLSLKVEVVTELCMCLFYRVFSANHLG